LDREEMLRLERDRWTEFLALIDRIPAERMEGPTLNDMGWSIKDLLWHMRCWDVEIAHELERIRLGTYSDHDYDTDEKNARFLQEGRSKDLAQVRADWLSARDRALEQMAMIPEVTAPVEEWFSEHAYKHMDDHLPELQDYVGRLAAPSAVTLGRTTHRSNPRGSVQR
jgi:mycothiol maleylpyruvate isomerase-like protein